MNYYRELGVKAWEQLKSMLVFDAVIYNEDRHFGNFGILRDNHTGTVSGPAPIFDNGLSLFNYAIKQDFEELDSYAKTRTTPYPGVTYEAICAEVMDKVQMHQLHRLIGFRFKHHPKLNLPDWRLESIENHIQKRIRALLELTPERLKDT